MRSNLQCSNLLALLVTFFVLRLLLSAAFFVFHSSHTPRFPTHLFYFGVYVSYLCTPLLGQPSTRSHPVPSIFLPSTQTRIGSHLDWLVSRIPDNPKSTARGKHLDIFIHSFDLDSKTNSILYHLL